MDYIRAIVLFLLMQLYVVAQPTTPSELGWPHPIPQLGNTNPPPNCPEFANPASLVVVTDTVTSISLPGGNGVFAITVNPAAGTLSGLNPTTGAITYTAGNTATMDSFTYCVSNSPSCMTCAVVQVNIKTLTQIACGACYEIPPVNGGIITGNIYFNTGIPNELVCIDYPIACSPLTLATNCTITDANGNAKFFVNPLAICPGIDTNYCIVELGTNCQGICYFTHVAIPTSGNPNCFGTGVLGNYYLYSFTYYPGTSPYIGLVLTNSGSAGGDTYIQYYSTPQQIDPYISNPNQYAAILDVNGCIQAAATNAVFTGIGCASSGAITGWTLDPVYGVAPLPTASFTGGTSFETCATNCP